MLGIPDLFLICLLHPSHMNKAVSSKGVDGSWAACEL